MFLNLIKTIELSINVKDKVKFYGKYHQKKNRSNPPFKAAFKSQEKNKNRTKGSLKLPHNEIISRHNNHDELY